MNRRGQDGIWDRVWSATDGEIETLHGFAREFYETLETWAAPLPESGVKALEPGAGTGRFSRLLARRHPGWHATAVDLSESSRKFYETPDTPENVSFVLADMFELPFDDGEFDLVFNEGVVEHFPDYQRALDEMARVTAPGGRVVVAVPNLLNLWHTRYKRRLGDDFEYGYERSFTFRELKRAFRRAGLRPIAKAGFDPAYGLERQDGRGRAGAAAQAAAWRDRIRRADALLGGSVTRRFGFEIAVLGLKGTR